MTGEVIIAEWAENQREKLRVRLDSYQGRAVLDVRNWYVDGGTMKPGRGLTVAVRHAQALSEALAKAAAIVAASEGGDNTAP